MNVKSLSRKDNHRKSLMRNLLTSIVLYEEIRTTREKARNVIPMIEKLFVMAHDNDLNARRKITSILYDKKAVDKVFEIFVPRYKDIKSGFVKLYNLGPRQGDSAYIVILKLVEGKKEIIIEGKDVEKESKKGTKSTKAGSEKPDAKKVKNIGSQKVRA